jgi:DNA-binding LacI/PurR family transcriptional regulator
LKVAKGVGYEANARGVALRTGKTMQVAVLMPVTTAASYEWDGVEYTQILSGISQAIDRSGYRLAIHTIHNAEDGRDVARRIVESGLADGLIFSGILVDDPRIEFLAERGFPFVSLGRCRTAHQYAHVDIDNEWAAYTATWRLIKGGHRRIALVNPPHRYSYALDRIDGFRRAYTEARLTPDETLVIEGDLTTKYGRDSTCELRSLIDPPTGFVCANEPTALGVLSGLASLGLLAGRDADVIGYDDINVSAYFSPPLTTLYFPIEKLGQTLGEFLLRRVAGDSPLALQKIYRPELIERQADRLNVNQPNEQTGRKP